jgi:RNA-dependent RNA polymerase
MIMEGLGVLYETSKCYQDDTVAEARESKGSLILAAEFLEAHGLGTSFGLTSVMLSLDALGVSSPNNLFFQQMTEFTVHHVLRELKWHARIPVGLSSAWPMSITFCEKARYSRALGRKIRAPDI